MLFQNTPCEICHSLGLKHEHCPFCTILIHRRGDPLIKKEYKNIEWIYYECSCSKEKILDKWKGYCCVCKLKNYEDKTPGDIIKKYCQKGNWCYWCDQEASTQVRINKDNMK